MDGFLNFSTLPIEHADYSVSDLQAEYQRYLQRQRMIQACLHGLERPDTLLDMLMEHGVDASEYVDSVTENIDFTTANRMPITDDMEFSWDGHSF